MSPLGALGLFSSCYIARPMATIIIMIYLRQVGNH